MLASGEHSSYDYDNATTNIIKNPTNENYYDDDSNGLLQSTAVTRDDKKRQ